MTCCLHEVPVHVPGPHAAIIIHQAIPTTSHSLIDSLDQAKGHVSVTVEIPLHVTTLVVVSTNPLFSTRSEPIDKPWYCTTFVALALHPNVIVGCIFDASINYFR